MHTLSIVSALFLGCVSLVTNHVCAQPVETQQVASASGPGQTTSAPALSIAEKEAIYAESQRRIRRDFTVEIGGGVGAGVLRYDPDFPPGDVQAGVSLVGLSLGGFLSPSIALLGRISSFAALTDFGSLIWMGPQLQFWPTDSLTLGVGFGVGSVVGPRGVGRTGFGPSLRAGYAVWHSRRHTLRIGMEGIPLWVAGEYSYAHLLVVEWQSH